MVQDFGLLLVVGVAVLVSIALAVPVAVLVLRDGRRPRRPLGGHRAVESTVRRVSSLSPRAAVPLLVVGALVVVAGLAVEGGLPSRPIPSVGSTRTAGPSPTSSSSARAPGSRPSYRSSSKRPT
jgi:hypothetical protein